MLGKVTCSERMISGVGRLGDMEWLGGALCAPPNANTILTNYVIYSDKLRQLWVGSLLIIL
jgi:hypothetical protein